MAEEHVLYDIMYDITLGMQHEMQHQELMVYDFQHYFQRFQDPKDNYIPTTVQDPPQRPKEKPIGMAEIPGGIYELGFSGKGFCYDNELPEHKIYLQPYRMDLASVTNGDFMKFVKACRRLGPCASTRVEGAALLGE
jgi:formylglycine-generating enzyme required for sulfatase activity